MAETLLSPGVLARENDLSAVTAQPIQAGAAIIGPTVKGPVGIPTLVTSYSEYTQAFGTTFLSGSLQQEFLTSNSAYNYFNNGGTTLLVTRVVSGSFTSATSTNIEGGESGVLETGADVLLGSIGTNPTDAGAATYTSVATTNSGAGTGAIVTAVVAGTTAPTITSITATSAGSGYEVGDVLTIAAGDLGTGQLITAQNVLSISNGAAYALGAVTGPFTVAQSSTTGTGTGASFTITGDATNVSALTVSSIGTGHAATDVITISAADLITAGFTGATGNLTITLGAGSTNVADSSAATITLVADDITTNLSFTLKTFGEGAIMNSSGSEVNGALVSGSNDNLRWEIPQFSTSSGTFTLLVRRGSDTTDAKTVLESFTNLSLDPTAPNYISKVIGDSYKTVNTSDTTPYVQDNGTYPNRSRYVYISAVNSKTPQYFDNNGDFKGEYTASLPAIASGSFENATGQVYFETAGAAFNEQIVTATNIQGLNNTNYTTSIDLLSNQDEYIFNSITVPGIMIETAPSTTTKLINMVQERGDAIAIVDASTYGATINSMTAEASSYNSSYAAVYAPWLQTTSPETGELVWVPASTMIPGVYAYNDRVGEAWFAPAGLNRGGLATVVRPERKFSQSNRDVLYQGKVNPIASFPGSGTVVFGQKTLQTKASALDRVNVRRLLIQLKSYISQVADNLVFEQNTIATRNAFLSQVNPYLESVQQRQGLYAFKVIMDSSNNTADVIDRNQLIGQIYLQPTKTAEFIYLDFNVLPTGATFPA